MINSTATTTRIKSRLTSEGFNFTNSPLSEKFFGVIVEEVLIEVLKASVSVPGTGLVAPSGPVSGIATGSLS